MASSPSFPSVDALLTGAADPFIQLLHESLGANLTEPSSGVLYARFVESYWALLARDGGLHADVLARLAPLPALLVRCVGEPAFSSEQHPAWHWLRTLQQFTIGYQPGLGRGGERLLAELETAVAQLERQGWAAAAPLFAAAWAQEEQRLQRLAQRLDAAERGQLRARQAQSQAARLLNRCMGGRQLPAVVVAFLQEPWFRELQWCLLTHGADSDAWRLRLQLSEELVASLQPAAEAAAQQALYELIPRVGPALRELLTPRAADPVRLEQVLAAIEREHLLLLRGEAPEAAPFALMANGDDWFDGAELSSELLAQVQGLAVGDWFQSEERGRLRLAVKMDDCGQLLFVNRLGVKACQYDFDSFAYRLAVADVVPLPGADCGRELLGQLLQQLMQQRSARRREREAAEVQAQARAAAERRSREEARAKAQAEAAALAAATARAAEERAREAAAQREAEQAQLAQARADEQTRRLQLREGSAEQRLRRARQALSLLSVGDWLELRDEFGGSRRLKVAVKLLSSARLILVDREGIKGAELGFDQLAAGLAEGAVQVLDRGPRFEDTLARVVDGLRRERSPGRSGPRPEGDADE